MKKPANRLACLAAFATSLLLTPAVTLAQTAPPTPVLSKEQPVLLGYAFMFLLTVLVVGVSLMPSKRSHQD